MPHGECLIKKLLAEGFENRGMPALEEIGIFWKSNTFGVRIWAFYLPSSACISFPLSSFPSSVNKMCEIIEEIIGPFFPKPSLVQASYLEHHCASNKFICKMGLSSSQSEVSILLNISCM